MLLIYQSCGESQGIFLALGIFFESCRNLTAQSLSAFGLGFGHVIRTDVADVMSAHVDDIVTLASASDAEDVVVVSFDFVSFHVFKIPQTPEKARDFFTILQIIFVDTPSPFLKKFEQAF
jgi:hypothetical protein